MRSDMSFRVNSNNTLGNQNQAVLTLNDVGGRESTIKVCDEKGFSSSGIFVDMAEVSEDERLHDALNQQVELIETDDEESLDSSSDEEEDLEEDEEWEERLRILEDARKLKQVAEYFLHPEAPIKNDGIACARCFFDRPSADQRVSLEEVNEEHAIMSDLKLLKQLAADYLHPELPVACDATATARCYFDRYSASEQDVDSDVKENIMDDIKMLKKFAANYLHPEKPVVSDASACARCYFDRPSAYKQVDLDYEEERNAILEDMKELKKLAVDYMHPELPVVCDATASARCYFDRYSSPDQEEYDEEERNAMLEDMKLLKKLAVDYLHPELPVACDATATARCYFDRYSAPVQDVDTEEKENIMYDIKMLKKFAADYLHPELPVVCDATATARCFFDRYSAPEQDDPEDVEEFKSALEDAYKLKKSAVDYLHPELSVVVSDAAACARCYFDRPSAPLHYRQVHTFGPHEDDYHHDEHHHSAHLDHFGMDEDMDFNFDGMRQTMVLPSDKEQFVSKEEEGNLSRSPSSVMLFTGESIYD